MAHNVILAHAFTVQLLRTKYSTTCSDCKIGITLNGNWGEPRNATNPRDIEAAQRYRLFSIGWFADPVFLGDYSQEMKKYVKDRFYIIIFLCLLKW